MMSGMNANSKTQTPTASTPDGDASAFARCAAIIAAEPDVAFRLAAIHRADEFFSALVELARQRGIEFAGDAQAVMHAAGTQCLGCRLEAWRPEARPGWQPFALECGPAGMELVWGCGTGRAGEPFHELTVATLRARPLNRWFAVRTPLSAAFVAALEAQALPLSGLIFHMSRCGSTLIAQALKAWTGVRALSEPALLDTAITFCFAGHDPDGLLLRGVVAGLAQPGGDDSQVIIKLDAWHALAFGVIRSLLPAVPWLFVYRDPIEVMASHRREPGRHTVPGMLPEAWLGDLSPPADAAEPQDYAARVIGGICAAIVPHAKAVNLFNYSELPDALTTRLPRLFALDPDGLDGSLLDATLARHAKRPYEAFTDDRAAKRAAADMNMYHRVGRWIEPHFKALEEIRCTLRHLRLPIACDLALLRADLAAVAPIGWHPHFNREYYSGDWSGIALRAQSHGRSPLYADPTRDDWTDTEAMRACRYVPRFLAQFECRIESVRFLKLAPDAIIREHRDFGLRFEDGSVRFHVPVHTDADVEFVLGGETLVLAAGECWYLNFDLPHQIANRGARDRVHLVIDARVNAWVKDLFRRVRAD